MTHLDPASLYHDLTQWFNQHARPLPWRKTRDPWAILLCEVMSQQTPVARVEPTWYAWLERWPTPKHLARATRAEVLLAWEKMGYPRRALRLRECAREIVDRFDGEVPHQRTDLLSLPGIGPYTADAVLAFAYEEYSVVLDTNIRRVLARWHGEALPAPTQTKAELERAHRFVPTEPDRAWQWNAAIMEFGALICTARNPQCLTCPVVEICGWKNAGYPTDAHATKRTTQKWEGTNRQARGAIMAILRTEPTSSFAEHVLQEATQLPNERFTPALNGLVRDGLVSHDDSGHYSLPHT